MGKILLPLLLLMAASEQAYAQYYCAIVFVEPDENISSGKQLSDEQKFKVETCLRAAKKADEERAKRNDGAKSSSSHPTNAK